MQPRHAAAGLDSEARVDIASVHETEDGELEGADTGESGTGSVCAMAQTDRCSETMVPAQLALCADPTDSMESTVGDLAADSGGAARTAAGRPLKRHLTEVTPEQATAAMTQAVRGLSKEIKQSLSSHGALFPADEALRGAVVDALERELQVLDVPPCPRFALLKSAVEKAMRNEIYGTHSAAAASTDAGAMKEVWQRLRNRKSRRRWQRRPSCGPTLDGRCPTCGQPWPPRVEDPREAMLRDVKASIAMLTENLRALQQATSSSDDASDDEDPGTAGPMGPAAAAATPPADGPPGAAHIGMHEAPEVAREASAKLQPAADCAVLPWQHRGSMDPAVAFPDPTGAAAWDGPLGAAHMGMHEAPEVACEASAKLQPAADCAVLPWQHCGSMEPAVAFPDPTEPPTGAAVSPPAIVEPATPGLHAAGHDQRARGLRGALAAEASAVAEPAVAAMEQALQTAAAAAVDPLGAIRQELVEMHATCLDAEEFGAHCRGREDFLINLKVGTRRELARALYYALFEAAAVEGTINRTRFWQRCHAAVMTTFTSCHTECARLKLLDLRPGMALYEHWARLAAFLVNHKGAQYVAGCTRCSHAPGGCDKCVPMKAARSLRKGIGAPKAKAKAKARPKAKTRGSR